MAKKDKLSFRINEEIKSKEVRLVGDNIEVGVYSLIDALDISYRMGLDLVEINSKQNPPICKIIDYKKFLFDTKKKQKELEKKNKQNAVDVKELRFRPNIDDHDFEFKKNHARNFIKDGDKVKGVVMFKGREITFKEQGEIVLLRLADDLSDVATVENLPKFEGNKLVIMLKPKK